MGNWNLRRDGRHTGVSHREQRVIAALALRGRTPRAALAELLWPDSTRPLALESLRVSVWAITHKLPGLLAGTRDPLELAAGVHVDVHDVESCAADHGGSAAQQALVLEAPIELLQGWYDDWVLPERDRVDQLRIRAMEQVAELFLREQAYDRAIEAASRAAALDPFRENAHRLIIQAHLLAGNRASAAQSYRRFSAKVSRELGVGPSPELTDLIRRLGS
ncbi:transcriptional regulator [Arthrobacter sp. I2-34]|uniref:Transcriptional regulator n=1 Tax=Arthrobacter hankyongi TaxID=2904801 RepID=A0ABS9L6T0_9MICC|nr:BTAD domain-containing putative transcriptional regulator [Arthrobacter hankyongi]MCG2622369.1 transcriptional regulator [Arthrobacter hankyongi]